MKTTIGATRVDSRGVLATILLAPVLAFLIGIAFGPFLPAIASDLGTTVAVVG